MLSSLSRLFKIHSINKSNIDLIRNSKYFDEEYYLTESPNVKGDACKHYYYHGWKEGKSPSFEFYNDYYLNNYRDVKDAGINPLVHYLRYGKAENRMIAKDNKYSIEQVYSRLYKWQYFYKAYISDFAEKRINLLFDSIDESVEGLKELFVFLSAAENYGYKLRIVYEKANFVILNSFLKKNDIKLPEDTVFMNMKKENYLEIGIHEKFVCASWKVAKALLNTACFANQLYYYFNTSEKYTDVEKYRISNICEYKNVTLIAGDEDLPQKYELSIETNGKTTNINNIHDIYCDFGDMFIDGVEIIDTAFATGLFDERKARINFVSEESSMKFHLETDVVVKRVLAVTDKADLVFCVSSKHKNIAENCPLINACIKKADNNEFDVFKMAEENKELFFTEEKSINTKKISKSYNKFEKCVLGICGEINV